MELIKKHGSGMDDNDRGVPKKAKKSGFLM